MAKIKKFENRRDDLRKEFEQQIRGINAIKKREIEKKIVPLVDRIAKLAEEVARKFVEENIAKIDAFNIRKRDATPVMESAVRPILMPGSDNESGGRHAENAPS